MIESNQYVREVFSMLGNLCIPTINHVIKEELNHLLNDTEEVLDDKDLTYLIQLLIKFDINALENKHDQLNINFVEMIFALYEVWIKYIESEIDNEFEVNYHIDKQFSENMSEKFFMCILDQKFLSIYKKLYDYDFLKEKLINTKIENKYIESKIKGSKKNNCEMLLRIKHVFKVIKDYLIQLDADLYLFKFIEGYEQYCLMILESINDIDQIMIDCKEKYINMCIEVFGEKIELLYQDLEKRNIYISMIKLKVHILEFLKMMVK
ncbi:hypothetical protein KHQ81_02150 [Mycoplasmatota bacterium]|nr:hypothetical protein KHQ81_02150 [Mycoplasmatota bacterium]